MVLSPAENTLILKFFQAGLKDKLLHGENVIADSGYSDERCEFISEGTEKSPSGLHSICQARHETANRRLKQFGAIGQRFRHDKTRHAVCFHAVTNLTHLMIENGEPLFSIKM